MLIRRTTVVLLLILLVAGCSNKNHGNAQQMMTTETPEAPWHVTYRDGSNNGFQCRQDSEDEDARFEYSPITPETSSSGIYSGGEAKKGPLNDNHVAALWRWVVRLESDTSLHADSRMMGTGAFTVTTASGTRRFIVKNGPFLREFDAFLAQLRD